MSGIAETFDRAAGDYAAQLDRGISLSGENADYFVRGRVEFLASVVDDLQQISRGCILDFGCGVGNACHVLRTRLQAGKVIGLDCSNASLSIARQRHAGHDYHWTTDGHEIAPHSVDIAYTSGVFHHIHPTARQAELVKLSGWLKPGGMLAFFENNPWNPGTRWVMSRIPFDRDAQCLSPIEAQRRLRSAGFSIDAVRSLFFFPRLLAVCRPLERYLSRLPVGAQYVVVARRPSL